MTVITINGLEGLSRKFQKLAKERPEQAKAAMIDAARESHNRLVQIVNSRAQKERPFDRGMYLRGWGVHPHSEGAKLLNSVPYAGVIEEGARPHWAPIQPLTEWVLRKLIGGPKKSVSAYASDFNRKTKRGKLAKSHYRAIDKIKEARGIAQLIQFKIAKRGQKGRFVMKETSKFYSRIVRKAIKLKLKEIL